MIALAHLFYALNVPDEIGRWTGVGATVGATLVVLTGLWQFQRELVAEYRSEVVRLNDRVDHLEAANKRLQHEIDRNHDQLAHLRKQVRDLGGDLGGELDEYTHHKEPQ